LTRRLSRKTLFASLSRCGCGRNANFTQHVSLFEQVKLLKPDRETTGPIEALSRGMFIRNSIQTHACSLRFPVIISSPLDRQPMEGAITREPLQVKSSAEMPYLRKGRSDDNRFEAERPGKGKVTLVPSGTLPVSTRLGSRCLFACPKHGAPPLLSGRPYRPIRPYQTIAGTKRVLAAAPSDAKLRTT
jgi:hypothetical protein